MLKCFNLNDVSYNLNSYDDIKIFIQKLAESQNLNFNQIENLIFNINNQDNVNLSNKSELKQIIKPIDGVQLVKNSMSKSEIEFVLNPTLSVLDKQKVDLTNAIEFEGYYILDNKVYNNQGIEVYNPDVLQDFKLEKIKPTEEQQKVIDRVKEFIKSPNKELLSPENVLMISGAGGTGKTFSITRAARQLQKEKYVSIAFSAPTHNAKRELQKSLNDVYGKNRETAHTNASLFALDYNPITGKTTKRIINESFPPEYWNKSVIILDEYSMLGGELWKMIQERLVEKQEKGYGHTKIIFTGDYAQIPVPDSSRKEFMDGDVTNWIYHNRKDRVEGLYTNMRAKFADLANASAKIRTYIDRINNAVIYKTTQEKPEEIIKDFNNSFIKNKETSTNVKYYNANNKVQWLDSYIDAYKNLSNRNPYFGVIVNYNNSAHINNINLTKKIREELFGLKSSNRFNEGELLIIDNNTLNAGLGTLGKDMRVYVESITKTKRKQNFSYRQKGVRVEKYFSIEFDAYQITATTDGEDVLTFYVPIINETVLDKYKNQDFDFLNIQGEKPENINQLIAIIDPNIAQVSYGYVVNSHKVQGSSYDQVWVQEDNILTAREPKEVLQLLYTAYSRPKYKTHSLNNSSSIEIKEPFEPFRSESKEQPAITEQIDEISQIYSQLGNQTQSENISIESWANLKNQKEAISPISIISTRIPNTDEHFGNPFSHDPQGKTQGLIQTETIKEAVEKYIDWVINGANFEKKNLFTVKPIQSVDKKATIKASIATQYIGFAEGIEGSSTALYAKQISEQNNKFKIPISKTLNKFLEPFFNSNDESIVEPLAKNLTNEDKQILAKSIGKSYKDINQFDWYEAIWSDVGIKEVFYYLKTGNNLEQDVQKEEINSQLYNEWQNFVKENKEFVDSFYKLPKETQKELKKDFDKLREKNDWYVFELSNLNYDIRKNLLKQEGYLENKINTTSNIVNSGNYSSNDVIFVSIGGKRGNETVRKEQQDRTIREAIKAIEAGATLITDNVNYIHYNYKTKQQRPITMSVEEFRKEDGLYNEGEKRLYENLKAKGYNYSEQTVDGQLLGIWTKSEFKPVSGELSQHTFIQEENNFTPEDLGLKTNISQEDFKCNN